MQISKPALIALLVAVPLVLYNMNWLKSKIGLPSASSSSSSSSSSEDKPASSDPKPADNTNTNNDSDDESEERKITGHDDCSGCDLPCSTHKNLPKAILSKIEGGKMSGSVKPHRRHVIIAQGVSFSRWPNEIKDAKGSYAEFFSKALKAAKDYPVKLTACDAPVSSATPIPDDQKEQVADLYLFPDQVLFKAVTREQVPEFIQKIFVEDKGVFQIKGNKSGKPVEQSASSSSSAASSSSSADENFLDISIPHTRLNGTWFLVCSHKLRDKRCGVSGPILADELEKYSSAHTSELSNSVHTLKISHIGGHKFAGNVIVYPSGTWYGRVTPCHVEMLVKGYAGQKEEEKKRLEPLVRGGLEW